jgi:3-deoxy-D-manno-octulosonic acid kinase
MAKQHKKKILCYRFGFSSHLDDEQLKDLLSHFPIRKTADASLAGGRAPVVSTVIKDIGPVVIKQYLRGGLMRFVLKNRYVKCGKTRSQVEYEIMQKLRRLGLRTPEPVAYAYRGFPLYSAWLITRKIETARTLAELSRQDVQRVPGVMGKVLAQIDQLVECGFMHVDLHPGNILVDGDDNIFILDFDKGYWSSAQRENLCDTYCKRWQRAVSKHRLPKILKDMMQVGPKKLK